MKESSLTLIKGNIVLLLFLLSSCSSIQVKYDSIDKKACAEYEKQLEFIENYNFYLMAIDHQKLNQARVFFENLTGHKSNADIQYDGQLTPTIDDYINWTAWYSLNHNKLRYDKKTKSVHVINETN